ncbi:MAG: hypothetical protein ACU88J_04050 [Gammaproteobacteria bacterium]
MEEILETSHENIANRLKIASIFIVIGMLNTGCMTFSGTQLSDLKPIKPNITVTIEESISKDFEFHLDGGGMVTSNKAGRMINDMVLDHWKDQKYISDYKYVKLEKFTESADYDLTLKGTQMGESSVGMQIISGLTLMIIPYSVKTTYDLEYVLKNVKTGKIYTSKVTDDVSSRMWLLFFPAFPFSGLGLANTIERISEHVYQDFVKQGAFSL